ncbi:winged helix-turn-helix transcriptional regulator [Actinomyces capricornis]|uniref:winged helix-turn-helix transcriptional regulator n=1 Tax=Actinomyces capricornis TaxID=2755559 RepID=UPI001CC7E35C|nr:winged helix-turn-helix transcriptional regulator [Actinomyces capricornis]
MSALRFGELQCRLQGISPKVLTATLRRLGSHGLVHREVIPAVPLHVEYSPTDAGRSAVPRAIGRGAPSARRPCQCLPPSRMRSRGTDGDHPAVAIRTPRSHITKPWHCRELEAHDSVVFGIHRLVPSPSIS